MSGQKLPSYSWPYLGPVESESSSDEDDSNRVILSSTSSDEEPIARRDDEPRTMGDNSFEMWMEGMAGMNEESYQDQDVRIPQLSSSWAYRNWLQRVDGAGSLEYNPQWSRVQRIRGSRIPVLVDGQRNTASAIVAADMQQRLQNTRIPTRTAEGPIGNSNSEQYYFYYRNTSRRQGVPIKTSHRRINSSRNRRR
jgi:hypothetical protein